MQPHPCQLDDATLLRECRIETYRSRGPGGQKKNKTSSAVRLTHLASGLVAVGTESRSQHDNKSKALKRLRIELALGIRRPFASDRPGWWGEMTDRAGRLMAYQRSEHFPPMVACVLDAIEACDGSIAGGASLLGTSTANLVAILSANPRVWAFVQDARKRRGHRQLIAPNR